jgi:hypothetical protein
MASFQEILRNFIKGWSLRKMTKEKNISNEIKKFLPENGQL